VFKLVLGELRIEGLSPQNAKNLNQFFIDIQQKTKAETISPAVQRVRRTVQIKKQQSELCLGASKSLKHTDSIAELPTRIRSETVNHSTSGRPKLSKTISSKSLKRTLSVGKFSRDKITKSSTEVTPTSSSSKSRTEKFFSLTDKMKRKKTVSSGSAPLPRKSKKKGTL
jgi:hypothetical protein